MAENLNMVVILNNIRSSENVGSIFRTADAFGVKKIYLCGYTPTPLDRFNRKNTKLTKASLGAEEFVVWEKCENLEEVVIRLKDFSMEHGYECLASLTEASTRNFSAEKYPCIQNHVPEKNITKNNLQDFLIVGVEQSKNSIDYREIKKSKLLASSSKLALVFGNETEGLSPEDLKLCDIVAEIPMLGKKESLNVAVSAGIVLSSLSSQP